jgi:hypothetical protein
MAANGRRVGPQRVETRRSRQSTGRPTSNWRCRPGPVFGGDETSIISIADGQWRGRRAHTGWRGYNSPRVQFTDHRYGKHHARHLRHFVGRSIRSSNLPPSATATCAGSRTVFPRGAAGSGYWVGNRALNISSRLSDHSLSGGDTAEWRGVPDGIEGQG